ncbi:MAG: transcription elongation factor GreA [Candidatus Limosilactobacillus merdavium]|uniref:Transcription elongation factor GreA n=1 Tax=Candidatus Limosilactobacillus merdavium TaxID=2838651 RepID=A0A9E2NV68_9LACO|nr:transcription elongation factor GreA [Candidatus Limosilactobacillus merdavium]
MQRKKIQEAMAHVYFQKMTPTGYHEIEEEIEELKKQRPAKIEQLKAARALGDLSENTEYSTAKRELRHLESRMRYLNKQLQYAEIVKPNDSQTVDLGTTVTLQFEDDDETVDYIIVGKQEADLKKQKVSFDSPLGQAVLHHKVGETVTVQAPQSTYGVKILAVKLSDSDNDQ